MEKKALEEKLICFEEKQRQATEKLQDNLNHDSQDLDSPIHYIPGEDTSWQTGITRLKNRGSATQYEAVLVEQHKDNLGILTDDPHLRLSSYGDHAIVLSKYNAN